MSLLAIAKKFASVINWVPFINSIVVKHGNKFSVKGALLIGCKVRLKGVNNSITIGRGTVLYKTRITINGEGNSLKIGDDCVIKQAAFVYEDDENAICVGNNTRMMGKILVACLEGRSIEIGSGCLFSSEIEIRTSDSHSLLDEQGKRINQADNISIGDRVWLGSRVLLLKGVELAHDVVVGGGSIVTKKFVDSNCVIAGNPARLVKKNVSWQKERV